MILHLHYVRCATVKVGYRAEYCIDAFEVWKCSFVWKNMHTLW